MQKSAHDVTALWQLSEFVMRPCACGLWLNNDLQEQAVAQHSSPNDLSKSMERQNFEAAML